MLETPDIFVSYASQDRERVRSLVETLRTFGWSVWWDRELRPGETWDDVIGKALEAARCVVVVWSARSVQSDWVKIEAEHARQREALVPVYLEMVTLPAPLDRVHGADLTSWNGEAWHTGLQQAVTAIREKLTAPGVRVNTPVGAAAAPVGYQPPTLKEKVLDAAVARELPVNREADLIVMVRHKDSGGLRAILTVDDGYSTTPEDVRSSESFEIEFPRDAAGMPGRAILTLKVHSRDVEVTPPEKQIAISPEIDSAVYAFLVTPRRSGSLLLNLDLFQNAVCLASRILRTDGVDSDMESAGMPRHIVSMTLPVKAARPVAERPRSPVVDHRLASNQTLGAPRPVSADSGARLSEKAGVSRGSSSPISIQNLPSISRNLPGLEGSWTTRESPTLLGGNPGCALLVVVLLIVAGLVWYFFLR